MGKLWPADKSGRLAVFANSALGSRPQSFSPVVSGRLPVPTAELSQPKQRRLHSEAENPDSTALASYRCFTLGRRTYWAAAFAYISESLSLSLSA